MTVSRETRERPIIFSGPMINAILAGRKSQTRRVVRNPDHYGCLTGDCPHERQTECDAALAAECPYGKPGDRLWVRESLALGEEGESEGWVYAADRRPVLVDHRDEAAVTAMVTWAHHKEGNHCPSIHMPRWASRITLEVTEVRVQRLQEISEEDVLAEGITELELPASMPPQWGNPRNRFQALLGQHQLEARAVGDQSLGVGHLFSAGE